MDALGSNFDLGSFSGVPPIDHKDFSKQLRLIAAEGGYSQILCYWARWNRQKRRGHQDHLVGADHRLGIAGPKPEMRVNLRAALVDVASGHWRLYRPQPIEDERLSAILSRQSNDHDQVVLLKTAGYTALAHDLMASAN